MIKFSKFILFQTAIIFLILLFPVLSWGTDYINEMLCAFLLSTVNVMVGYYLVIDSFDKKNSDFYKTVYGGMLARMVFIFGFTIFMINSSYLESIPFVLSLMFFYVIHQWTEISFWIKNLEGKTIEV